MLTRYFASIGGAIYLATGISGFIPGLTQPPPADAPALAIDAGYGYLFGLFPINGVHNPVHLAIGDWGLVSFSRWGASRVFARGLTVVYGLLAVMGSFPGLNTMFGLAPLSGHDIWLDAGTAAVAAYSGWLHREASEPARTRA
jgi:hypothetical protein